MTRAEDVTGAEVQVRQLRQALVDSKNYGNLPELTVSRINEALDLARALEVTARDVNRELANRRGQPSSEPTDVTDRLWVMSAILEREATTDDQGKLDALKRLLVDADLEIVNLRLRLRHAYDREEEQAARITERVALEARDERRGWRWWR